MRNLRIIAPVLIILATAGCRIDMHVQPRQNPLSKSDFFADGRSARPRVEGTVARGEFDAGDYFRTGKIGANPGDYMPFPVTAEVLSRGRERFNIYCAPCHSRVGDGEGFIPTRGFGRKPPSYHIERLEKAPVGYIFGVMTEGFGIMQDYSSQISPRDRWCIVAYIRALQLSQHATVADAQGNPIPSLAPEFVEGTGATLPKVKPPQPEPKSEESK
jgi:mono/diheme cytochrome c family protein